MPEKIILEDGSEREVPTEEELESLRKNSEEAERLKKDLEDLEKTKQELEESQDPNYKKMRETLKAKEKTIEQLKELGKKMEEDGTISDLEQSIDPNEIIKKAAEESKKAVFSSLITEKKEKLLKDFDEDQKNVIEKYFNKLTTGEELTLETIDNYFEKAKILANSEVGDNSILNNNISGKPPVFNTKKDSSFAETDEAKNIAKEIWGDQAYSSQN